jgi:hypothetical protein
MNIHEHAPPPSYGRKFCILYSRSDPLLLIHFINSKVMYRCKWISETCCHLWYSIATTEVLVHISWFGVCRSKNRNGHRNTVERYVCLRYVILSFCPIVSIRSMHDVRCLWTVGVWENVVSPGVAAANHINIVSTGSFIKVCHLLCFIHSYEKGSS